MCILATFANWGVIFCMRVCMCVSCIDGLKNVAAVASFSVCVCSSVQIYQQTCWRLLTGSCLDWTRCWRRR